METTMMSSKRAARNELVVVTGASTGIGAATARELAHKGFHVLAGVRREVDGDALRADGIEPHILDITVESDVAAIADRVARDPLHRPLRAPPSTAFSWRPSRHKPARSARSGFRPNTPQK